MFPFHKQLRYYIGHAYLFLLVYSGGIHFETLSLTGYPYWGGGGWWFSSISLAECSSNIPKLIPCKFKHIRQAVHIPISLEDVKPTQLKQHLNERIKQCTMYNQLTTHSIPKLVVELIQWYSTNASRLNEGRKWHSEGSLTFCKSN